MRPLPVIKVRCNRPALRQSRFALNSCGAKLALRALVTGAGGFIGSHLVELLVDEGYNVRALTHADSRTDNLALLPTNIQQHVEICPGDLRDAAAVRAAVEGVDHV